MNDEFYIYLNKLNNQMRKNFLIILLLSIIVNYTYIKYNNITNIINVYNVLNYISFTLILFTGYFGVNLIFLSSDIKDIFYKNKIRKIGIYIVLISLVIFIWAIYDIIGGI